MPPNVLTHGLGLSLVCSTYVSSRRDLSRPTHDISAHDPVVRRPAPSVDRTQVSMGLSYACFRIARRWPRLYRGSIRMPSYVTPSNPPHGTATRRCQHRPPARRPTLRVDPSTDRESAAPRLRTHSRRRPLEWESLPPCSPFAPALSAGNAGDADCDAPAFSLMSLNERRPSPAFVAASPAAL